MSPGAQPASSKARGPDQTCAGIGQVEVAVVGVLRRLALSENFDPRSRDLPRNLGARDDHRAAAVGHHAAIQTVQRIAQHRRVEHLVDGDRLLEQRVRVVLRVLRGGHLHPRQLLTGRPELVHVPLRCERVHAQRAGAVDQFERAFRALVDGPRGRLAPRTIGQRHQRHRALALGDRRRGVADVIDGRGTAHSRPVYELQVGQPEVVGRRNREHAAAAHHEQTVDVRQAQPGVGEHPGGVLRVDLRDRTVRDHAVGVLEGTHYVRLASNAHFTPEATFRSRSVRF